jgi:hypothetical protein
MKRGGLLFVISILLGAAITGAFAQTNDARIEGIVSDVSGLPLPGAQVILSEPHTGFSRPSETTTSGTYEFPGLRPGQYELTVKARGFTTEVRQLILEVNQALRADFTLRVGELTQHIEVVSSVQMLRTNDASLGEVIEPTLTSQLPLNGRHLLDLAQLAPSVHQGMGAQSGSTNPLYWRPQQNSALSVGGGRPNANHFLLDGSTDTDPTFNTLAFSPSPDGVREFKVQTSSYSAEFGGAGGAQVNIVTKSGGNALHGDVYAFNRTDALDARTFTDPSQIPHLAQNQFGGALGGPIRRNRAFIFFNYEGFRLSNGLSQIETVPTAMERMGDFSASGFTIYDPATRHANPNYNPNLPAGPENPQFLQDPFANDTIPANRMNSVAMGALNSVPLPNLATGMMMGGMTMDSTTASGPDSNNYLDLRTNTNSSDQGTVRLDRNFSRGDNFFARYSLQHEEDFTPENLPGFGSSDNNQAQNLTLSYNRIFSSTTLNTLWFGLSRLSLHRYSQNNYTHDYVDELGIQGVGFGGNGAWGMPYMSVQGYTQIGDSYSATPMEAWDTMLQLGDIWNHQMGRHSVRVGADFRRYWWPMWGFFQNRGYYQFTNGFTTETATNDGTGAAMASFLLGLPVVKQRQAGIPSMDLRQWGTDEFVQDDWRVTKDTTLNLGLRYEFAMPLSDVSNTSSNLVFRQGTPYAFIGGQLGMPRGLMDANHFNFAPRLGFAHIVHGRLGFVVRGAYGIFYTPIDLNTFCNQRHVPPLVFAETQQSDNYTPSLTGFNFNPAVLGTTKISFASAQTNAPPEYINQWSFSLQKTLPGDVVLEVGYQGAHGLHLQRAHLINNAAPGPGVPGSKTHPRPFQTISFLPGTVLPSSVNVLSGDTSLAFPVSTINYLENSARSWYDAGWVDARRRLSRDLTFLANYTYAKSLTDAPDFRSPMDEPAIPQNNSRLDAEKGLACDVRQRFVASFVYSLPGWQAPPLLKRLSSGWSLASVYQAQTGFPFTISVFGDTANAGTVLGENPVRANLTGEPILSSRTHTSAEWFNPAAFAAPPAYQFGGVGRNTVEGPGMQLLDLALTREFPLTEGVRLQFRGELFNALNHTNYGTPNRFVNEPQFGTITMAMHPGRQAQLSARLTF